MTGNTPRHPIYPEKKRKIEKVHFSKLPPVSQKTRFPIHPVIYISYFRNELSADVMDRIIMKRIVDNNQLLSTVQLLPALIDIKVGFTFLIIDKN